MSVRLLGAGDVREAAARLGVRPTKKLGQNFVVEQGSVRQIAALAAPVAGDVVLEVGPGLGSLTLALLERAAEADAKIVAVEIDPILADALPGTIAERAPEAADRVRVVAADALRVTAADLTAEGGGAGDGAGPTVLAANLPYNVAVPVVLHLLEVMPSLDRGVVMVQAEVADRMCAPPGSRVYGAPSAKIAWYATAKLAGTVPRTVFWPVPNVDSKLVAFSRHKSCAVDHIKSKRAGSEGAGEAELGAGSEGSRKRTFAVIDAAFGQRRKTLRAALAGWAGSPAAAEKALRTAGVDPSARGESLGIADFARVAEARPASA